MFFSRHCPSCHCQVPFKHRLAFLFQDIIFCACCKQVLTPTLFSRYVFAPIGLFTWFYIFEFLRALGVTQSVSAITGALTCYMCVRLGYSMARLKRLK